MPEQTGARARMAPWCLTVATQADVRLLLVLRRPPSAEVSRTVAATPSSAALAGADCSVVGLVQIAVAPRPVLPPPALPSRRPAARCPTVAKTSWTAARAMCRRPAAAEAPITSVAARRRPARRWALPAARCPTAVATVSCVARASYQRCAATTSVVARRSSALTWEQTAV